MPGRVHGLFTGRNGELLMVGQRHRSKWIEVVCFGPKRHYRKDGTCNCAHIFVATKLKRELRSRVKIVPFGGKRRTDDSTDPRSVTK